MKTIWKYQLAITDTQYLKMPARAQILSADAQDGVLCIWAAVDPEEPEETREIEIIGTGNPVYEDMGIDRRFVGTVLMTPFVWHVFERL